MAPLGEAIEYDEAKRRAEAWISQMAGAAVRATKRSTIRAALEAYLADPRVHGRAMWARKVRAAIAAHNKQVREQEPKKQELPVQASAYSFRHARISELLQVHGVDPLTVAAQTGTSLAMIERAYLRFIPSAMREKLAHIKDSA